MCTFTQKSPARERRMAAKKESQGYLQIVNSIKRGVFAPIYVLMGEEAFYIDRIQKMIEETALNEEERDFNLTVFYGMDCDMHDVVNTCRRYPVMSRYQVVVLKEAQNASNLDLLRHYAAKPLMSTILVVCNKGGNIKAPELMAALKANGNGVVFESKKLGEQDVAAVIRSYVQEKGCRIDEKSVSMMKDFVGTDVSRLVGELDKLLLLVGDGGDIVPETIERNIGISKDFNNFELENAVRARDAAKAFRIIDYFERNPKRNPTVLTVGVLFSFFSNLLLVCTSRDKSEQGIMAQIETKSAYRARLFIEATRNYNTASCVRIISYLREFDARSKGVGSRQNEYALLRELMYKIFYL